MSETLWTTTVTRIGTDAQEMFDAGVLILFAEPVPPALADVSVVHTPSGHPIREIRPGDVFVVAGREHPVEDVGEKATENLRELGHVVLYLDAVDQKLLPGAVHVRGEAVPPAEGQQIILRSA
ncbi:PTS glucitol/sorbitol transporter subunit IIA [Brachybacterium sp. AOP43-C2-M15]|uniref:PTS glucitol/sorbitol transporter subunit IIA n=1 Tax=Brachybacterium sp. AOP43-C2-M15 TaxID=3457661 RepID=UPI0040331893